MQPFWRKSIGRREPQDHVVSRRPSYGKTSVATVRLRSGHRSIFPHWENRDIARDWAGNNFVTIACYLSPEGVVLGADSTTTYGTPTSPHYFNNAQKLFEVGEDSTLGAVTWGMGGLNATSHRSLLAKLDDSLAATPAESALQVAERWISLFWKCLRRSIVSQCGSHQNM